jgi:hypothetical protein
MKLLRTIASFCLALELFVVVDSRQPSVAAEKLDKVRFTYAPLSASGFLWFIAKDAGYFEKYPSTSTCISKGHRRSWCSLFWQMRINLPAGQDLTSSRMIDPKANNGADGVL